MSIENIINKIKQDYEEKIENIKKEFQVKKTKIEQE